MASLGMPAPLLPDPRSALSRHPLEPAARSWLADAEARVAARPAAVRTLFPAARRHCGRGRLDAHWTADEAARAVLLMALPLTGEPLAAELAGLYRHGDPAEQRAVLRTLPLLDAATADVPRPEHDPDPEAETEAEADAETGAEALAVTDTAAGGEPLADRALPLVREALRGNDSGVIEAALGPYGAARLPDAEYRQAVLKCVFQEIPLDRITGLDTRADGELARMLADFAHERVAAGRDVPLDIWPVVRAHPARTALAEKLTAETRAAASERREAAERALEALR